MIVVIGRVLSRPEMLDEVRTISLEHVHRSRREPGCLLHSVHHDVEEPRRLVFIEHWADRAALDAHFRVPASRDFAKALGDAAAEPPTIEIYDAEKLRF